MLGFLKKKVTDNFQSIETVTEQALIEVDITPSDCSTILQKCLKPFSEDQLKFSSYKNYFGMIEDRLRGVEPQAKGYLAAYHALMIVGLSNGETILRNQISLLSKLADAKFGNEVIPYINHVVLKIRYKNSSETIEDYSESSVELVRIFNK